MELEGKVALITGSSQGIGKAIALKFAEEGASVVHTYHQNKELSKELEKELIKYNGESFSHYLNVASLDSMKEVVDATIKRFGRIDILINNAGFYSRNYFFESSEEIWDKTLDINLRSVFFFSKMVSQIMINHSEGSITNISSNSAAHQKDYGIEYGISKTGVNYLTLSLAKILAQHNIRVNSIAPGYTETEMSTFKGDYEARTRIENKIPLKRVNQVEDIANCALFLASNKSRNITGQVITIDGGYSL